VATPPNLPTRWRTIAGERVHIPTAHHLRHPHRGCHQAHHRKPAARARATDTLRETEAAGAPAGSGPIVFPSTLALGTSGHTPPQRHPFPSSQHALQTDGYQQGGWSTDLADAPAPTLWWSTITVVMQVSSPSAVSQGSAVPRQVRGRRALLPRTSLCTTYFTTPPWQGNLRCWVLRTGAQEANLSTAGADWAVACGAPAVGRLCEGRRARQAQAPADLPQLLAAVYRRH